MGRGLRMIQYNDESIYRNWIGTAESFGKTFCLAFELKYNEKSIRIE